MVKQRPGNIYPLLARKLWSAASRRRFLIPSTLPPLTWNFVQGRTRLEPVRSKDSDQLQITKRRRGAALQGFVTLTNV